MHEAEFGVGLMAVSWLLILAVIIIAIIAWYKIFSKAGYSGWFAILMLIPAINIIVLLIFAFSDWPVQKEIRALKNRVPLEQNKQ